MKNSISPKSKNAFSLIELSIVLLIIGIIIAGITQSSRLLRAYKISTARTLTQSAPVSSIKNVVLWLDSTAEGAYLNQNDSADIDYGDTIKSWKDVSSVTTDKLTVTQATQGDQPTYTMDGINGLPTIRFDSAIDTQKLSGTAPTDFRTDQTVFVVFKWRASNANGANLFALDGTTTFTTTIKVGTDGVLDIFDYNGSAEADNLTFSLSAENTQILTRTYNTASNVSQLYINGTSIATNTASVVGNFGLASTITIGNSATEVKTFGGDVGEIIIFERALKTEERKSIENYLSKKWGVAIAQN